MPLTTQDAMLDDSGQGGAEIEVTPAMIEAGLSSYWLSAMEDEPLALVREVYISMESSRLREMRPHDLGAKPDPFPAV